MSIPYKLAFFDLDGTIVNSRFEITDRTRRALQALESAGVKCAIATGRPLFSTRPVIEQLAINGASMVFSGAMIYDPKSASALYQSVVPTDPLIELVKFCRRNKILCELYSGDQYFVELESPLSSIHYQYLKLNPVYSDLEEVAAKGEVIKICLMLRLSSQEEQLVRLFCAAQPELETGYTTGTAHPEMLFANITNKNATRAGALNFLLRHYAVSREEIMAFGDGEQDGHFVSSAGFGVAMQNGSEKLKAIAKHIAKPVDEDGVAVIIEDLLSAKLS